MAQQIPSCEYLEFIPTDSGQNIIEAYSELLRLANITQEERNNYADRYRNYLADFLNPYEPYCSKNDCPCIILESPIISEKLLGGMYQPFFLTLMNARLELENCKDRQFPKFCEDGFEPIELFFIQKLLRGLARKQKPNPETLPHSR